MKITLKKKTYKKLKKISNITSKKTIIIDIILMNEYIILRASKIFTHDKNIFILFFTLIIKIKYLRKIS